MDSSLIGLQDSITPAQNKSVITNNECITHSMKNKELAKSLAAKRLGEAVATVDRLMKFALCTI